MYKKQILKRNGNYILRKRRIKEGNLYYTWIYSKELDAILKTYGKIKNWQLDIIENSFNKYTYAFDLKLVKLYKFSFRNFFKECEEIFIKELLQYYNKVGKYAYR